MTDNQGCGDKHAEQSKNNGWSSPRAQVVFVQATARETIRTGIRARQLVRTYGAIER
jgi:hypothetical protein